jgi:hypothetical protein
MVHLANKEAVSRGIITIEPGEAWDFEQETPNSLASMEIISTSLSSMNADQIEPLTSTYSTKSLDRAPLRSEEFEYISSSIRENLGRSISESTKMGQFVKKTIMDGEPAKKSRFVVGSTIASPAQMEDAAPPVLAAVSSAAEVKKGRFSVVESPTVSTTEITQPPGEDENASRILN